MRSEDGARYRWLVAQVTSTAGGKVSNAEAFTVALGVEQMGKHKKRRMRWSAQRFFVCCRGTFDRKRVSRWWWQLRALQMGFSAIGSGPMATSSMRSDEQHHGGCHCSKCLGGYKWEEKGKATDEAQRRETGGGTLVESCFNVENSGIDRRILANLEKELQAAFRFADGNGEPANSI